LEIIQNLFKDVLTTTQFHNESIKFLFYFINKELSLSPEHINFGNSNARQMSPQPGMKNPRNNVSSTNIRIASCNSNKLV